MVTGNRIIAAIMVCCSIGTAVWYVNHKMASKLAAVVEAQTIRHDPFADQLKQKITVASRASTSHTRSVIFDNDAASDDALALILIGNDPSIVLKAITVSGTGEAHGKPGAENMAAIAYMLGKPDVPVAFGHSRPLSSAGKAFPSDLREIMDNMLVGKNIKRHPNPRITDNAVGLMKQVIESSNEKVTILATGPLTNVAEFVTQYPGLKDKIERIVIMGGALNVSGNIEPLVHVKHNVSEWNFYADPEAAHRVFASHVPITLVALDATNQVPMTKKFYDSLSKEEQPELKLTHQLLKNIVDRFGMGLFINDFYLWDALAALVMLDPDTAETESLPLVVDVTNGQLRMAKAGDRHVAKVDMVTKVNQPEAVLSNFVAQVKSNHIFAQRQFHYNPSRVTANFGRPVNPSSVGTMHARLALETN